MALLLQLSSVLQSNDCTTLKIQDSTGVYASTNLGGWGSPNTALSTVNGSTNVLTINITITTSNGTETVYDPINLYTYSGNIIPSAVSVLVVYVTPAELKISGDPLGISTDKLPDGWYNIEYKLNVISTGVEISSYSVQCFIDGTIRNKIYTMLRDIPTNLYINTPNRVNTHNWEELTHPLYVLSIFEGTIAYVTTARKNEVLNDLYLIESLTYNITV